MTKRVDRKTIAAMAKMLLESNYKHDSQYQYTCILIDDVMTRLEYSRKQIDNTLKQYRDMFNIAGDNHAWLHASLGIVRDRTGVEKATLYRCRREMLTAFGSGSSDRVRMAREMIETFRQMMTTFRDSCI